MGGKQKYFSGSPPEVFILGGNSQIFCFEMLPNPQKFSACGGQITSPPDNEGELSAKNGFPPNRGGKLSPPDVSGLGGNFPPQTSQDWGGELH